MPSDRRLHPLSILFGFVSQLAGFALPGILLLVGVGSAGWDWQKWTVFLVIPQALVSVARYISFRYRYEANEMVIRSGLFFRNERHIPYSRIQNLDAVQNVLHRLFGVIEVHLETGGGDEPEAKMSVLPLAAFEEMQRHVFTARGGGAEAPAGSADSPAPERTLLRLAPRELLLCGLIENRGIVILAAAFGLLWELGMLGGAGFDKVFGGIFGEQTSGRGLARAVLSALLGQRGLPVGRIALALGAFLLLLLVLRLVSMLWALIRLHGFRLTLAGEDLRTELGLLTRVVTTIPLRRIQTLTIREGPLHQLFGRAAVRVDTAEGNGGEEGEEGAKHREWLAPILRREELPGLLREVLPGLDLATVAWNAAHPRAFRRELKGWIFVAVMIALPFVLLLRWWDLALLAALLAWGYVAARLHVAHLGWAVTDRAVLFRSGWLWRQVSVAPFAKIQAVALHQSPFDRRAAMAQVSVDTAGAGDLSHRVHIPYLARETARDLYELLALQAARTAFRW